MFLHRFTHAIADLSINELKIHFLGSTKVQLDEPYQNLNKMIIKQTKKFYHEAAEIMQIHCYKEVIEQDFEYISKIILPVTTKELYNLMQNSTLKYLRYYIEHRFRQFKPNPEVIKHILNDLAR